MVYRLNEQLQFPHPSLADDDGLLAVGGDLTVDRLILAYKNGIFPWYSENTPILWYAPKKRFVLNPDDLIISKSMRQVLRAEKFKNTHNQAFKSVIENCAQIHRKDQDGTWITTEMQEAYIKLHQLGYAHSIETYNQEGVLVGGLYGVLVGKIFCGESMFSSEPNASKQALIYLCQQFSLKLIDCQVYSDHLASLGAVEIEATEFYTELEKQHIKPSTCERTF